VDSSDRVPRRDGRAAVPARPGCVTPGEGPLRITFAGASRLVLAGDIDQATTPALAAALSQALDGSGEIHLDLAGVEYCDLAGLRMLIGLTGSDGEGQQPPRRVVHHLPAHLRNVIEILGWDTAPGLAITG
jgi:anti-anti-sigma factor